VQEKANYFNWMSASKRSIQKPREGWTFLRAIVKLKRRNPSPRKLYRSNYIRSN